MLVGKEASKLDYLVGRRSGLQRGQWCLPMVRGCLTLVVRLLGLLLPERVLAGRDWTLGFELLLVGGAVLEHLFVFLLGAKVIQVCLVDVVRDDVVGLLVIRREPKDLNVLVVGD